MCHSCAGKRRLHASMKTLTMACFKTSSLATFSFPDTPRGRCFLPSPGTPSAPSCPGCSCSRRVPAARRTLPSAWPGRQGRGGSGRPHLPGRPPSEEHVDGAERNRCPAERFTAELAPTWYRKSRVCRERLKQARLFRQEPSSSSRSLHQSGVSNTLRGVGYCFPILTAQANPISSRRGLSGFDKRERGCVYNFNSASPPLQQHGHGSTRS